MYSKLSKHIETTKPKSKAIFVLQNIFFLIAIAIFCVTTFLATQVFVLHLSKVWAFKQFFFTDLWGFFWLTLPEYLIFAVIFIAVSRYLYTKRDFWGYKFSTQIATFVLLITIFVSGISSLYINNNKIDVSAYQKVASSDYRLFIRDKYVQKLDKEGIYYGLVVGKNIKNQQTKITINHGGVLHDFNYNLKDRVEVNELLWVKYTWDNNAREVVDVKNLS